MDNWIDRFSGTGIPVRRYPRSAGHMNFGPGKSPDTLLRLQPEAPVQHSANTPPTGAVAGISCALQGVGSASGNEHRGLSRLPKVSGGGRRINRRKS